MEGVIAIQIRISAEPGKTVWPSPPIASLVSAQQEIEDALDLAKDSSFRANWAVRPTEISPRIDLDSMTENQTRNGMTSYRLAGRGRSAVIMRSN